MLLTDGEAIVDRVVLAVKKVRERLERSTQALERWGIPYVVSGGNAVLLWVERHGEGGERMTPNVDLLVNRADAAALTDALVAAGFLPDPARPDLFRDGPDGSPRTRLRLLFAGEKVRHTDLLANPNVSLLERISPFQVLSLEALVQTKLTANRTIDKVHLRDLLDVGLIDQSWKARYPAELAERLQLLIGAPDG